MSNNILKFLKENKIEMKDAIGILSKELELQEKLMTREEREEKEKLAAEEKAKQEAAAAQSEPTPPAPEPPASPDTIDPDKLPEAINKIIETKLTNLEVNLTNHINDALKIPRKHNPPGTEVDGERAAQLNEQNKVEFNHFEIKV
jgi:hypothetical protein